MEEPRRMGGGWGAFPRHVRHDNSISFQARVLYGELIALQGNNDYCWPKNKTLAGYFDTSESSVKRWLRELKEAGHIRIVVVRDSNRVVIERRIYCISNAPTTPDEPLTEIVCDPPSVHQTDGGVGSPYGPYTTTGMTRTEDKNSECSLPTGSRDDRSEEVNTHETAKTDYAETGYAFSAPDPFIDQPEPMAFAYPFGYGMASSQPAPFTPPTADEVREYAETIAYAKLTAIEEAERFVTRYEETGWRKGNTPIADWKALVRSWKLGDQSRAAEREAEKEAERRSQDAARPYGADNMPPVPSLSTMDREAAWDFMNLAYGDTFYATKQRFRSGEYEAKKRWSASVREEWAKVVAKAEEDGFRPRPYSNDNGEPKWFPIEG